MSKLAKPLCFIDIETSGLDPARNQIHEITIIRTSGNSKPEVFSATFTVAPELWDAHARELHSHRHSPAPPLMGLNEAAKKICEITKGCVLVGNNTQFDASWVAQLLRHQGLRPQWHYQVEDVEARIAQALKLGPAPFDSEAMSRAIGVDPLQFDRHTSAGDARWSMVQYEKLTGLRLGSQLLGSLGLPTSATKLSF